MAYLMPIVTDGCTMCWRRTATMTLFNGSNARLGHYCSGCAPQALERLKEAEQDQLSLALRREYYTQPRFLNATGSVMR